MKFEDYKEGFTKVLSNPDTALTEITPLLNELKTDLDTLESTRGEVETLNSRIRDLQDTNMKLFLSQGGKSSDEDEYVDNDEKAVEEYFEQLGKEI